MELLASALLPALGTLLSFSHISLLLLGLCMGLILGVLPGLSGIAGLSLLIPFAFGMEPSHGIALMIGLLSAIHTSDTLPAVLMGIPGTAAAQATIVDGYPMAKRGEAARALSAAFFASMFGGLIGSVILTGAIFAAKPVILAMGFGEILMLTVFALTMVGVLTGQSVLKSLAAASVGLLLGAVGVAPATGEDRMNFGSLYLGDGLSLVVVALGIFAIPEIVELLRQDTSISRTGTLGGGWMAGIRDVVKNRWLVLRCSVLGAFIGALPGLGGSVADWICYGHTVQTSRNKEEFGKGDVRGVIGPESGNNAIVGGALIPTILFGVPGSGGMAVLLGGLVIIGVTPGPSMVTSQADITFIMIWSLALANVFGTGICFLLARQFAKITTIQYSILGPIMLSLIFFGAFQASRNINDIIGLIVFGCLGIFMKRFGWSRPALLIGFVLSSGMENSVYRAAQIYGFSFLERPIVLIIIAVTIISVAATMLSQRKSRRNSDEEPQQTTPTSYIPQISFTLMLVGAAGFAVFEIIDMSYLGRLFPMIVGSLALVLLVPVAVLQIVSTKRRSVFFDEDAGLNTKHGAFYFIVWMIGYLVMIRLVGLPIGTMLFISAMTSVHAKGKLLQHIGLALGVVLVFSALSYTFGLYYPRSVLSAYFDLPWWL